MSTTPMRTACAAWPACPGCAHPRSSSPAAAAGTNARHLRKPLITFFASHSLGSLVQEILPCQLNDPFPNNGMRPGGQTQVAVDRHPDERGGHDRDLDVHRAVGEVRQRSARGPGHRFFPLALALDFAAFDGPFCLLTCSALSSRSMARTSTLWRLAAASRATGRFRS